MADVQFLGFSIGGFPTPEVSRTVVPTTLPEVENIGVNVNAPDAFLREVVPTNQPEVMNFGVTANIVSPGQTAGVLDAPDVQMGPVLPTPPLSTSPATGIKQPLSALLRVPFVPPAPAPTTTVFEATLDTVTPAGGISPAFQFDITGQFVRFASETLTPALRGVAGVILSTVFDIASGSWQITLVAPLPAVPVDPGPGPVVILPHDTFFIEENPATIVAHLFGEGDIVAVEPDATIKTTIPGKEVILS